MCYIGVMEWILGWEEKVRQNSIDKESEWNERGSKKTEKDEVWKTNPCSSSTQTFASSYTY